MKKLALPIILFLSILVNAQNNGSCNCCSENHKAFDFWIGEWEVTNYNNGKPAGSSVISREEDGCVIRENWTSAQAGYTGTSMNFYNASTGQWEQLWVDNAGAILKLKGNRVENQMILTSDEFIKEDGKKYRNRITWTKLEDGSVRQLWEVLQGETLVSTAFDGLYKRK
ncbi:hypothetical protein [Flagellimonas aequoris]|uniref:Lipocalin-like domain-containing protein n=1 Tax=Flagellimonas aequoris TaxID=2306997 RepID=A0A418N6P2_9FLAO|nr:hypothetical protein [Allomuricauda aequoris]RIV69946.1 hypothetical protein D2U88_12425 [Allomuricauda aequoris]TXK01534.1 hypothetical protein FQ019_12310 [Allomuricauda aequoris]